MTSDEKADAAEALAEKIAPMFAGLDPDIIGAALADLTAIWLAGHRIVDDGLATAQLRDEVLRAHTRVIRKLTTLNAKIMGTHY